MLHNFPLLIIPAFNPDKTLEHLLEAHRALNVSQIGIVVNDGSDGNSAEIFTKIEALGYIVLHHDKNLGKGAALKTAMNYYLNNFSELPGVITADADGQHSLKDIIRLSKNFLKNPKQLHLGVRQISKANIPLRSRLGNTITRFFFNWFTHNNLIDTQTGLRAIPIELIKHLVNSKTNRYEFEFEMFFIAKQYAFKIKQTPIDTIYIDNNKGSHFKPFLDSLKIYVIFIRFCCVGISSFILDFTIFALLFHYSNNASFSVLGARALSIPFNFFLNKNISFKCKDNFLSSLLFYLGLSFIIATFSLQLMLLIHATGLSIYLSKIIAEFIIFLANFFTQLKFIFNKRSKLSKAL